jgi:hypothetical protein
MSNVLVNGGTALEWSVDNPILPVNFVGVESDTDKSKIGNGMGSWNSLPYEEAELNFSYVNDIGVLGYSDTRTSMPIAHIRDTPINIAVFGDSTANIGNTSFPANQDLSTCNTAFPASGTSSSVISTIAWRLTEKYPMAKVVFNGGVASETLAQMLARDLAGASITRKAVTDIISTDVDLIIVRMGTNSLGGDEDADYAEYVAVLDRLLTVGVPIIVEGVQGRGKPGEVLSNQPFLLDMNRRVAAYVQSLANTKIVYFNPMGILCDENGCYLPGMTMDGTHLGIKGQDTLATEEAKLLTAMFGISAKIRYPGTNLATNQLLLSTTTETYGTLAVGFNPALSAYKTISEAKIETVNGVLMQTVKLAPTGAGAAALLFKLPIAVADLGTVVSGDKYGIEFDYFIQMVDQSRVIPISTNIGVQFSMKKTGAGTVAIFNSQVTAQGDYPDGNDNGINGHCVFNPIVINTDTANLETISLSIYCNYVIGQSSALNVLKFGAGGLRIVKV